MNLCRDDRGWRVEEPDSEEIQILFEEASKGVIPVPASQKALTYHGLTVASRMAEIKKTDYDARAPKS